MSEPPLDLSRAELTRDLDGILAVDAATFDRPWTRAMYEWEWTHSDVARFYVARRARARSSPTAPGGSSSTSCTSTTSPSIRRGGGAASPARC